MAIVARRRENKWNIKEIMDQFVGYCKYVSWIDAIKRQYQFGLESWYAISEIDWHQASVLLRDEGFVENVFDYFNEQEYSVHIKSELFNYIQAIHKKPPFLEFMKNQDEKQVLVAERDESCNKL